MVAEAGLGNQCSIKALRYGNPPAPMASRFFQTGPPVLFLPPHKTRQGLCEALPVVFSIAILKYPIPHAVTVSTPASLQRRTRSASAPLSVISRSTAEKGATKEKLSRPSFRRSATTRVLSERLIMV